MKVKVGIVGLPNVGKSTLFNALAQSSVAQAANFPFCTIEPNTAPIAIPDDNLDALKRVAQHNKAVPATLTWIDVAGLVRGASRGEGLGNRFLATIRECDAILHVVRYFENDDIVHVDGKVDPVGDAEVVNLELIFADLAQVEKRLERGNCVGEEREALEKVQVGLSDGKLARSLGLNEGELKAIKSMGMLTLKPVLYAFNVDDVDFTFGKTEAVEQAEKIFHSIQYCDPKRDMFTLVSAELEAEVSSRTLHEQEQYLTSLGLDIDKSNVNEMLSYHSLPLKVMELLNLSLCYTGPGVPPEKSKTTKSYLFQQDSRTAWDMAGRLHGEIQRGFQRAEIIKVADLLGQDSYTLAKESGCVRTEGKEYVMNNDEVILIKWR
jgi:GTP-binding protein YchF